MTVRVWEVLEVLEALECFEGWTRAGELLELLPGKYTVNKVGYCMRAAAERGLVHRERRGVPGRPVYMYRRLR